MTSPRPLLRSAFAPAACAVVLALSISLSGCAGDRDPVAAAEARVAAEEKAVAEAEAEFAAASAAFCDASETYILALDRYGDVLSDTAPTVGDVRAGGADLVDPREDAFDGAEAVVDAQQELLDAQQELADARAALAEVQSGETGAPAEPGAESAQPSATPLAPEASVERVRQAESDFASAQSGITDDTPLSDAAVQFNSAALALEMAWLRLFADTGCITDEQAQQAAAAVYAYTVGLQQELATAGYYTGEIDGVYGPLTAQAVEELQRQNGLPVTGWVDRATAEALQAEIEALGGAAAAEALASTAAVQQTLKLVGFWDGPVDGVWTPELTAAVQEFQVELGVEPTGVVDAATIAAFEKAMSELQAAAPSPTPTETPTEG